MKEYRIYSLWFYENEIEDNLTLLEAKELLVDHVIEDIEEGVYDRDCYHIYDKNEDSPYCFDSDVFSFEEYIANRDKNKYLIFSNKVDRVINTYLEHDRVEEKIEQYILEDSIEYDTDIDVAFCNKFYEVYYTDENNNRIKKYITLTDNKKITVEK